MCSYMASVYEEKDLVVCSAEKHGVKLVVVDV